jgi:two-component system, LuxR family, sensor kinase FixL
MPETLESESLRLIIDSLPTGTIIVNQSGRILMLNRKIIEWFGYSKEEILEQAVELLIPERFNGEHPAYRDKYFANPTIRPMGSGRTLYARRSDGSEFQCDISLHPLPLKNGIHALVHIVDATSRLQSEALQRHEESLRRMKFMVENLPTGAIYVSLDSKTWMVNRAFSATTGYSSEEIGDIQSAFTLLFRDQAEEVQRFHDNDKRSQSPISRVLRYHRKDGRQAWVEVAVYRYNNHEVWLWHDVTDRMAAQEQLVQAERLAAIGEMVTGLAHESRNALQRAMASLEMLDLDLEQQPHLKVLSRRAASAIDELQRLYEEVRDYAAPIQLDLRDIELEHFCLETWSHLTETHRDKKIDMTVHCSEGAASIHIDKHRMRQVFRNVFENAIAVLPTTGGKIEVTACIVNQLMGNPSIEILIHDNGPGMNAEQKAKIFVPFYTTKSKGTGLGMAIVRRIMQAHGGDAEVGSCERGALIILRLPMNGTIAT